MKQKILIGYTFSNLFIFLIPIIFSLFINYSEPLVKTFALSKDKQDTPSSVILSVMNSDTKAITNLDIEEYLIGVVSAEMPASYEPEALKAQAVAARSYIMSKIDKENPAHPEAIVCNNPSHCKGHLSLTEAKDKWGESWETDFYQKIKSAVESTKGECLTYKNEIIEAFFFALSNGKTESAGDVWGSDLPYLKSTNSKDDTSAPDFFSSAEFSISDFNKRLKNLSSDFKSQDNISIKNIVYTDGGRVKSITINNSSFSGTDIRTAFSLNSADFTIKQDGKKIIFNVKGKGHGVGMSQYGANALAKKGYNYKQILKHYYSGVEIINK